MRKIVLASNNEKKVKELKNMLNEHNFEICSLKDENIDIKQQIILDRVYLRNTQTISHC